MNRDTLTQNLTAILYGNPISQTEVTATLKAMFDDRDTLAGAVQLLQSRQAPENLARRHELGEILEFAPAGTLAPGKIPQNRVSARALWWGYQVYFPEPVMKDLKTTGNITTAVASLLAAASATCPPIAPFVGIIAAYVALEFVLLESIDAGYGVMLSATWLAPGILVPTRLHPA